MPEATVPAGAEATVIDAAGATARGSVVAAVGVALPEHVIDNEVIATRLGVSPDWIESRTGVRERRIADPGDRLDAYAAAAADAALRKAGVAASDVDLLLVATMAADEIIPNAAPLVAAQLGAGSVATMDVGAACTGFLSALSVACGQIEAGRCERALVVGADLCSRVTDRYDRRTAGLFADGAGAVVVGATAAPGLVGPVISGCDGAHADLVKADRDEAVIRMNGHDTFRQAVARLSEVSVQAAEAAGRELDEIDLFVYHQANSRILVAVGEQLGLPAERVIDSVPRFGNTSAATIPIALSVAEEEGRLEPGTTVLAAAFGSGLTWAGTVLEWGGADG